MKILIKFPTRDRPEKFFNTLDCYYSNAHNIDDIQFLISCDCDDIKMNNPEICNKLKEYKNLIVEFSNNNSKIEAVNAGLNNINVDYDIILLASDDMIPVMNGYDEIIRTLMINNFPDTDGVLWFNDGIQRNALNTLCILGKNYYNRFGYIYHPDYKSFYSDNEFTEVSIMLNKVLYFDKIIIKHDHHCINENLIDDL